MITLERGVAIRIRLLGLIFILTFALVGWRAFSLQVLQGRDWIERAARQHQKTIPLTPQRGTIFDRNGEALALSMEVDSIYAEPRKLENREHAARLLAPILGLPLETLRARLSGDRGFVWLKRQVPPAVSKRVRDLKLEAVGAIKEHQRFYPNSTVGAQLVGFTGLDPKGLAGLEASYDKTLLGRGGYLVMERDALGRGLGASGLPEVQGATRGHDLHLTIDKNMQYIVERELAAGVREYRARAGAAVVLEPATGKILALASQPDFNPNSFGKHKPEDWRNRVIGDTFEPGSTMKVILMAAALNEGVVKPNQLIHCENGSYRVGGRTIHDHHPYGLLTAEDVLKVSSNIGSAKIGKMLERKRLHGYLREFGFGQKSGIDLPGEEVGILRDPSRWFEIDIATISFGQGVAVTPLQLAAATAVIANGGYLMEPYLVERVTDSEGQMVRERQPKVVRQVISTEVATRVSRMMELVTGDDGTGIKARVPGYRVAGKTGTAQKVDPVTGGYSADKRIASFVGFVPAEAPRLVVMVMIDEPRGQVYGGVVAAPVFSRISTQALQYLRVMPNQPLSPGETLPSVEEILAQTKKEQEAAAKLSAAAGETAPSSGGAGRTPAETEDVLAADEAEDPAAPAGPLMPDFKGMSYREVIDMMQSSGINISLRGHGRVIEQSPPAGAAIPYGATVWVRLAPPGQADVGGDRREPRG